MAGRTAEAATLPLSALGPRIVILGPSNSGKSTLAAALGRKLARPVVHLDQLRHLPGTDWVQRPDADFARLHGEAIAGPAWIIEGNYAFLLPPRLKRATGAILLDDTSWANLARYLRRTLFERDRAGHLDGAPERVKGMMIHWILAVSPRHTRQNRAALAASGLPLVSSGSMRALRRLYAAWQLEP